MTSWETDQSTFTNSYEFSKSAFLLLHSYYVAWNTFISESDSNFTLAKGTTSTFEFKVEN